MNLETISQFILDFLESYGTRFIWSLVILVAGIWLAKAIARLARRLLGRTQLHDPVVSFIGSTAYFIMLASVVIAALNHLGVETTSFVALLGAIGLAVGLALQGSLANFASGVLLVIFRPFRGGDFITISGVSGTVEDIQFFSTRLRTSDNKLVFVPNAKITSDVITNFSAREQRRLDITVKIGYDSDLLKAKNLIADILAADERILPEPIPVIAVMELAENGVQLIVRPWVNRTDYWNVWFHLLESIKLEFDKNGIEIPHYRRDIRILNKEESL